MPDGDGGARLISKVYHADPLTCRQCGGPLQILAYVNDHFTIKTILDRLGLSPPEIERPPPQIRYVPSMSRDETSRAWSPRSYPHRSRAGRRVGRMRAGGRPASLFARRAGSGDPAAPPGES